MTREEASFILANIDRRVCDDELNDALDMAIKVLDQEPCGDCIRKQDEIRKAYDRGIKNGLIKGDALSEIEKMPSVQPKTGHWILDETDNSITCDKCGCLIWANDISNGEAYYCPNCGAKMEEAKDD